MANSFEGRANLSERELLLRLTKKDFIIDTFRVGGAGGQRRDKVSSGVRIRHTESGASSESRDSRYQHENKKIAFRRLINTTKFQAWLKRRIAEVSLDADARRRREKQIEEAVNRQMAPDNIICQVQDDNGKWIEVE